MANLTELTKIPTELKISPTEVNNRNPFSISLAFILYPTGSLRRLYAGFSISIDIEMCL